MIILYTFTMDLHSLLMLKEGSFPLHNLLKNDLYIKSYDLLGK